MKLYKLKIRTHQEMCEVYVACENMYQMEDLVHTRISYDSEIVECNMVADEGTFFIKKDERD